MLCRVYQLALVLREPPPEQKNDARPVSRKGADRGVCDVLPSLIFSSDLEESKKKVSGVDEGLTATTLAYPY